VQDVPFAAHAVATPDTRVYPGAANTQTAAAESQAHPVTFATHEPAHPPIA